MNTPPTPQPEPAQPKKKRRPLRIIGWILLAIPILLILSIVAGAIYQLTATALDNRAFGPPGKLVDIGGKRLHIYCEGEGSPTVVFEAGMGNSGYLFINVFKEVITKTRACLYDRPDLGWSDSTNEQYLSDEVASRLHTLLDKAGEKPPYIMVGHSLGGVYIRKYYQFFPDELVGMVLVDSAHENEMSYYPAPENSQPQYFETMMKICDFVAGVGVMRITGVMDKIVENAPFTPLENHAAVSRLNRVSYCIGIRTEKLASDIDLSQTDPPPSLGDLPLIVLTGAKELNPIRNQFYIGPLPPAQRQSTATWQEIQKSLVALSTNSEQVLALKSGHYIQWDEPNLVVDAIDKLVDGYSK
jgi:pimeloyl-ACP methyl ester carboxylesterase